MYLTWLFLRFTFEKAAEKPLTSCFLRMKVGCWSRQSPCRCSYGLVEAALMRVTERYHEFWSWSYTKWVPPMRWLTDSALQAQIVFGYVIWYLVMNSWLSFQIVRFDPVFCREHFQSDTQCSNKLASCITSWGVRHRTFSKSRTFWQCFLISKHIQRLQISNLVDLAAHYLCLDQSISKPSATASSTCWRKLRPGRFMIDFKSYLGNVL